jgi:hypothetical protein
MHFTGELFSQPDPLDFVLREPFPRAVVKLGRARTLVRRHFLRVFERTAVGEIGGDPGRAECLAADRRGDAGRLRTPADHEPGVRLRQRPVGQDLVISALLSTPNICIILSGITL